MGEPEERYSDVLKNFDTLVKGANAGKALRAGFDTALADATKDGKVDGKLVSLSAITAGLPAALAPEARAFVRRTEEEIRYRGQEWAGVALVGTLREYLSVLTPSVAEIADSAKPDPAKPAKSDKSDK